MNKEVLERGFADMKEKSRGGLSKGMSFLRSAAASHVLNTSVAGIESEQQTQQDSTGNGSIRATDGEKPSYDQLLSLSMKLTRQNKLMKAQLQKSQAQIQESIALQTNYETLWTFVKDSVGIDFSLCSDRDSELTGYSNSDTDSILRGDRLVELYVSKCASDAKKWRHEMEKSQQMVQGVPSEDGDASVGVVSNKYDEIDLFSALSPRASANEPQVHSPKHIEEKIEASEQELTPQRERLNKLEEKLKQVDQEKRDLEEQMQRENNVLLAKLSEANEKVESMRKVFDQKEFVLYELSFGISESLVKELEAIASSAVAITKVRKAAGDQTDEAKGVQFDNLTLSDTKMQVKDDTCSLTGNVKDMDIAEHLCAAIEQYKEMYRMANEEMEIRTINGRESLSGRISSQNKSEREERQGKGSQMCEDQLIVIVKQNECLREENERLRLAREDNAPVTRLRFEELRRSHLEAIEEAQAINQRLSEEKDYFQNKLEILASELDEACRRNEAGTAKLEEIHATAEKIKERNAILSEKNTFLNKEVEDLRDDLTTATKALESHAELAEKEGDLRRKSEALQKSLERDNAEIRQEFTKELESVRKEKNAAIARFQQERNAVTEKLNEVSIQNEENRQRCQTLQTSLSKSDALVLELQAHLDELSMAKVELEAQLSETKKTLSEKLAFATRLQTEHMGIAGKHAEQAAMIENALREAATANDAKRDAEANLEVLRVTMNEAVHDRDETFRQKSRLEDEMEALKHRLSDQLAEAAQQHENALANEKTKMQTEIVRIEMEAKTKSKLARHVVSEKENEIKTLQSRVAELEEDVRSGGADHRKILEFAQLQACRDAESIANALEIDRLHHKVVTTEHQMQSLVEDLSRKEKELTRLTQNQRRDGVNMEYLKNIVVQYITFRPGSSQQRRLLPVISTLLQFTHSDLKEIKNACGRRSSWSSWAASEKHKPLSARSLSKLSNSDHPRSSLPPAGPAHNPDTSDLSQRLSMLADIREAGTINVSPASSRASSFDLPSGLQHYIDAEGASPLQIFESTDF